MNKEMPETSLDNLLNLLQSADVYAQRNSYQQALDLYAQVIDTHLATHETELIASLERTIDKFLPQLAILLVEASCLIISEPSQPPNLPTIPDKSAPNVFPGSLPLTLSPLLTLEVRRSWLKRLFALWFKCRSMYQFREQLQLIMIEFAWSEDIAFLRNLIEYELQHASLASQSHAQTLEKLLKELPQ